MFETQLRSASVRPTARMEGEVGAQAVGGAQARSFAQQHEHQPRVQRRADVVGQRHAGLGGDHQRAPGQRRGGRIGGAQRFIGTALNMKPVLALVDGRVEAVERIRTKSKALDRVYELVEEKVKGHPPIQLASLHANAPDEARALLTREKVDLAIIDISLPGTSGIELIKMLAEEHPELKMLVMSMHEESLYSDRAFRAGAKGYVMKQEATEKLLQAIRKILNGGVYVSDRMQTIMVQRYLNSGLDDKISFIENLTDREFEILRMIGQGMSVAEIAEKLGRSVKTVEAHRANLREKLGLKRAAELARFAAQWVERGN